MARIQHELFDHLVGPQPQRWRDREAEGFGGLEVDHELELRRLLDGEVGGLHTFQDPVHEEGRPAPEIRKVHTKRQQTAGSRVLDEADRREAVLSCRVQVIAVYEGSGGKLKYSLGTVSGNVIKWGNPVHYDSGYNPSVTTSYLIDDKGAMGIVEVHQGVKGTGPLYVRLAQWNASGTAITWDPNASAQYAPSGCYPSVASSYGYQLTEVHSTACGTAAPLKFSLGTVTY